ncbi:MAG: SpoIVB peptidase [Firmicutes bacterium]|nr:SpoIVB peptidase [Bacillota bacterium]
MKKIAVPILAFIIFTAAYSYFLPDSINIEQDTNSALEFFLPLRASISGGDVQVLNINNAPAAENENFNASGSVLRGIKSGSMQLSLSLFGVPIKKVDLNVLPQEEYIASGETVGIVLDTDGVLVLGTGRVRDSLGNVYEPCRGVLRSGDMIKSVNGVKTNSKEELMAAVKSDPNITKIETKRMGEISVKPVISEDGSPMIGLWVRDSTQGIGTVTYFRKNDGAFGALGHPVTDVDTGELMQIRNGRLYPVKMGSIVRGEKGTAGELSGQNDDSGGAIGNISKNCGTGVYGTLTQGGKSRMQSAAVPVALKGRVHKGPASILADVDGKGVKEYKIEIESINLLGKNTAKGMTIRVTDPELIEKTGGIVQGMSGSPILQNGCLIGAVTHVFIHDPTKGYGIFIENMLAESRN